jgi:hypothetical protein
MIRAFLGLTAVLAALSGCAGPARYIERQADTGVVAIPANTDAWPTYNRREAFALIQKHVGPNFEIIEEREVATGQKTFNNQQVNNEQTFNTSNPFLPANKQTVQNTTTTADVTEYRIAYRRAAGAPGMGGGTLPGGAQMGLGAGTVQQTNYRSGTSTPGMMGGGVQPAGGIVPSAGPVNNGLSTGGAMGGNCVDGKCYIK